jgi:hypothetical protein
MAVMYGLFIYKRKFSPSVLGNFVNPK